MRAIESNVKQQ